MPTYPFELFKRLSEFSLVTVVVVVVSVVTVVVTISVPRSSSVMSICVSSVIVTSGVQRPKKFLPVASGKQSALE